LFAASAYMSSKNALEREAKVSLRARHRAPAEVSEWRSCPQERSEQNDTIRKAFYAHFGERFVKVRDYYEFYRDKVLIEDVSPWLPELASDVVAEETDADMRLHKILELSTGLMATFLRLLAQLPIFTSLARW
jgi:hypothetical protein